MAQATRQRLRTVAKVLPKPVQTMVAEVKDALQKGAVRTGRRSDRVTADLLRAELRPGDTCIDLGAGVGLLTIVMANLVGTRGRVLAFESNRDNGPKLLANARWCGLAEQVELQTIEDQAMTRLDGHLAPDRRIDLVRIDASIPCDAAFAGMTRILRVWRPTLLVECSSLAGWESCGLLTRHGYTLRNSRGHAVDAQASPPLAQVLATHPQRRAA